MRRWSSLALVLCACGRLGFDPVSGGDGGDDGSMTSEPGHSAVCDQPGVLLCDGFEPDTQVAWQPVMGNATVAMTTDMPHTGTRSLRAAGITGRTVAFLAAPIATVSTGELHLRGFFYLTGTSSATDILLARVGDGIANSEFFGIGGGTNPGLSSGASSNFAPPGLATDRWVCVEMIVAGMQIELRLDTVSKMFIALDAFGPYSQVAFGIVSDPGTPDSQVLIYIDDVVASTQPIGCNT